MDELNLFDDRGEYHCDDGPAYISKMGTKFWYKNGSIHRTDGPAVLWSHGSEHWVQNDKLHREDGPAVIEFNVYEFHIHGTDITEKVKQWMLENDIPPYNEWEDTHRVLFKLTFSNII